MFDLMIILTVGHFSFVVVLQIISHDDDSTTVALKLESGLGVLDAFFASFSMILVSEVRILLL